MSTIVTRAGKGSPLTNTEVDSNFTNLNTDKVETLASADGSIVITGTGASRDLSVSQNSPASVLLEQVRNSTGATLTKGTVVYISGATGQIPTVSKALATGDATSAQTLGLITSDLANNANGYATIIGLVSDIDTSAYTDGAQLYLSPTTAGTLTATKPYAPQHLVYVAVVAHAHPTQGKLFVKIQNGYEMDELHNVSAQSPTNGQTLVYNTTTSLWEKNTVSLTAGVNGTLPVANGGTGQTTLQNAMDALAGAVTSGSYLRGNGTDVVMSAIQAADVPTLNQNTTGTAANVTGTVAIANGGTGSTTATAALTALGAYPALNPSGYTSNTGTVTGVTGTAPVVSSGGTAPAISMAAASAGVNGYMTGVYATKLDGIATGATANTGTVTGVTGTAPVVSSGGTAPAISMAAASSGVNGYMTGTYATKLDGIATGATANTGTVTSVSGTGTVSGLTLSGTVTGSGSLTLGGAIGTLNQNTTGSSGSCTGNAATASAVAFSGITSKPTTLSGYGITNADVSGGNFGGSFNFNTNANLASGTYGFDTGALNGPASVTYSNFLQIKERPDTSAQVVVDYQTGYMYTRGIYLTAPTYSAWQTQLSSGNYNSYAPTLTGTGASGTWGINVTGTSGSISGFNNPTTAASVNTIVYRDGSGHITGVYGFFQYLNMSHGASGATTDTVFYSSGDDYIRKNNATGFRASLNVPTRTGGDASGTWNIKSRSLNAVRTSNTDFNSLSTAQDTFTAGTNYIPSGGAYNQPDTGDHHYLSWGSIDGSAWAAQLDIDFYTDRVWFRRQYSTTWQAWRQLIHDGNYNSYAPTLTGGSASGTWSINVTGSSASATFLNSSNYINKAGSSGNLNTDFSNTPAGSFRYNGDDANITNSPGGTWWIYQNMRHTNASNLWGTQVAWGWEDNANRLATRNVSGGGFGGWVYYLNSNNYTSYAPSLTGSGASGTWGINVTGNAANITAYTVNQSVGTGNAPTFYGVYSNNWFRSNGSTGWYNETHAVGIYATEAGNVRTYNGANFIAAGNVTAYSDERLKTNWRDMPRDFIERLSLVKNGTYDRTDNCSAKTQDGVSAQSLQPLMPNSILTDSEGIMSIAYGNAAMVSAVQLAKRVVEQEARIARLEALVNQLIGD